MQETLHSRPAVMNEEKARAMLDLANKLNNFDYMLRLKCEVCGPKLRGTPGNYPKCKRHEQ
jgi:hypothetical protein